ncbi:Vacuolar fusion protein CCZ1 [Grifola frondosa]|uniref:Vacuolar fusion protein CCZ1 n=1 Tax=Grifola frondosa TaxID=5627 RepID=A0A1C7MAB1_GRIFR|nr:Vacuolar fusion protein CCZ1 [Grifola frondosa]
MVPQPATRAALAPSQISVLQAAMSRVPPGLLYLTIYNTALRPDPQVTSDDDEDAEEQAQILFYTARERAVSRDRMLRQVGLAKALVNFSEMFNPEEPCENVHSQSRRMVMLSPEPNFWIHACVEVAKTPRPAVTKGKGKETAKGKAKDKNMPIRQEVIYDYHDGSVHDVSLRAQIQRSYEQFKLIYGSFSFVLSSLGQQALELQLERFFTVWAWKWDVEDADFSSHLGTPLHEAARALSPVLDDFASRISDVAVIPSVSSTLYTDSHTSTTPSVSASSSTRSKLSTDTIKGHKGHKLQPKSNDPEGSKTATEKASASTFIAMPSMNLSVDMRNLKWNWPGYLTFGKSASSSKTPSIPPTPSPHPGGDTSAASVPGDKIDEKGEMKLNPAEVEIDAESLREAIATDNVHGPSSRAVSPAPPVSPEIEEHSIQTSDDMPGTGNQNLVSPEVNTIAPARQDLSLERLTDLPPATVPFDGLPSPPANPSDLPVVSSQSSESGPESKPIERLLPSFFTTAIHLADSMDTLSTQRKRVLHLSVIRNQLTIVVVADFDHSLDLPSLAEDAIQVLDSMETIIERRNANGATSEVVDLDVIEVFSRGQNPQHWHIAKHGLGVDGDGRTIDGEVYMEVARKETTLTDVDNELAGVIRRFIE